MDCRTFRKHHVAFIDDTLPGVDVVRMQLHLAECAACEGWDQKVRRSLLVARNHLASIEPSDDFRARLDARLARERASLNSAPALFGAPRRMPVWSMVLGVAILGTAAGALLRVPGTEVVRHPGVVVRPEARPSGSSQRGVNDATPAYIATVSSGMAILPALMLVDEAPSLVSAADELPGVRSAFSER